MAIILYHYALLILIIPVILGSVFALKKWMTPRFKENQHIKLLNQISVGSKERVALLEFDNAKILVGITAHNVSTLYVQNHNER